MTYTGTVQVVAFLVFGCFLSTSVACFIRNCPPGGKRSLDMRGVGRQCMSCGPQGRGQCVGPNICCGSDFGCYFGTQESDICQKENESTTPCVIRGSACGSKGQGNCVANRICCDSDACSYNPACDSQRQGHGTSKEELLSLVQRLLRSKNYD